MPSMYHHKCHRYGVLQDLIDDESVVAAALGPAES